MLFEPMVVAGEDFDAALFTLLHGFYRPAVGCARNALELVTIGCACETLNLQELYRVAEWNFFPFRASL